jgi:ketosteroid isomerase-like protein
MSQENVGIVAACFRAWDRADPDGVVANYTHDVEVDASRLMEGVYRGREEVRSFYGAIFESLGFENNELELHPAGDKVVAITRLRGVGTASGVEVERPFAYVFTLTDGSVRHVALYPDPAEALEAAGLEE